MGSPVRIALAEPMRSGLAPAKEAVAAQQPWIEAYARTLTRFSPDSELSRFNADPRQEVPSSALLRAAVQAGLWAARHTRGLVDSCLVDQLERAGYAESRAQIAPVSLLDALRDAPPRRPAGPDPARRWAQFEVDARAGTIRRPPGVRFDTGGCGKGLAADAVANRLAGYRSFVVECGGDLAIGGADPGRPPWPISLMHPLTGQPAADLLVQAGGVATSSLAVRIWRRPDGSPAHHLLDPSTGEPAWTGLIGAAALGSSALEAETLSKAALLSGPEAGRRWLAARGGLLYHESGEVEVVGPLPLAAAAAPQRRVRVSGVPASWAEQYDE